MSTVKEGDIVCLVPMEPDPHGFPLERRLWGVTGEVLAVDGEIDARYPVLVAVTQTGAQMDTFGLPRGWPDQDYVHARRDECVVLGRL